MLPSVPVPLQEAERLEALRRFRILDTDPDAAFDDLAAIASEISGRPVALVTLVDEERQWFKARRGLDALGFGEVTETPRSVAFCAHTIMGDDILEVGDATRDERFATNPFVTGPASVRFYAGAPMVTADGMRLGSVCVLDTVPGELDEGQRAALDGLSRLAVNQLERHRAAIELREALERIRTMARVIPVCAYCERVRTDDDFWQTLDGYLLDRVGSQLERVQCPECAGSSREAVS
jgi:GAF domain-containing protein